MSRLEPHELDILYLQNDLAGIIVDEIVEDALRNGFTVDMLDGTDPEVGAELERLDAIVKLSRAAKWGRLYGAGYVLMVLDDGLDLAAPVEPSRVRRVMGLVELDRWEVEPVRWQNDVTLPEFGEPDLYQVSPQSQGAAGGNVTTTVHASRLLRFGGTALPRHLRAQNDGHDDSVLQRPWDAIRRFCEIESGMARIVQSFERATISVSGLASVMADTEGEQLLTARMELLSRSISMINAVLLDADAGEQYERSSSSVAGLPELRDRFAESVAKAARMPQTILFGTAPEGLNTDGESGIQAWHKRVHAYQEKVLQPELERLIALLLPHDADLADWDIAWAALDEPTELEVAELRHKVAETDAIYLDRGVRSPDQVARSRDGEAGWSMETDAPEEDAGYATMMESFEKMHDLDAVD